MRPEIVCSIVHHERVKRVFSLPLRALQGFIDSLFKLVDTPLVCPHYTCISSRAKQVEVSLKAKTKGEIKHLAIDATSLKVYGEGEWKVNKHGTDGKRRVWRKLHITVDDSTLEVVKAELSLSNVTDAGVFPNLLKQTRRRIGLQGEEPSSEFSDRLPKTLRF